MAFLVIFFIVAIDRSKYLQQAERPERDTKTVYVDVKLFEDFRKACGNIAPGLVLEPFMRDFVGGKEMPELPAAVRPIIVGLSALNESQRDRLLPLIEKVINQFQKAEAGPQSKKSAKG